MYVYVFICILYVFARIMHVFVRICKYAISTEKKLSILHDCASVHDLVVRCVCIFMYLVRICMFHVCIGTYQTVSVILLYVYVYICVYTFYKRLTGAFSLLVPAGDGNTIPLTMLCSKDAYYLCQ